MRKSIKIKLIAAITAISIAASISVAAIAAESNELPSSLAKTVYGDVDHDGYVSTLDAIKIMKHSLRAQYIPRENCIAAGIAQAELTLNGALKIMKISINKKAVRVKGASVRVQSKNINIGESFSIGASVSPSNATNQYFAYKSSNPNVAEVDSLGNITAKAVGNATVTATSVDGGYSAKCAVTVNAQQPAGTMSFAGAVYKLCDNYSESYLYDQRNYKKFVENGSNVGCSATSEAIGASMYFGKAITPDSAQIGWINGVGATFALAKYRYSDCSLQSKLKTAYNQLQKGNPTIINTLGSYGDDHWVTIIGVKTGANASSLKSEDFLIVNPWGGVIGNLGTYLANNGRSIPNSYSMRAFEE